MKHIVSEKKKGCGIACMAMILGISYMEVERHFRNDFDKRGILLSEVMDYMGNAGFDIVHKKAARYNNINFARKELLTPFAPVHIVQVNQFIDASSGHLLVMDDKGILHNPVENPDRRIISDDHFYSITSTIGFYKS